MRQNMADQWAEVHRWIDSGREVVERAFKPTPEEKNRILKERAKRLALEPEGEKAAEVIEIVEFMLAHERYGIEASYVREVYPIKDITPLPGVPPFVLGLINIRGHILSVLDLKKFFALPEKGITDLNKAIILHTKDMEFGILADSILSIRSVSAGDLQPSLPTLTGLRENYLKGITADRVVVLDAFKILSDKSIIVHEEA